MPQLDITTYASQIFWLVVIFVPLYIVLRRKALPRVAEVLQARQEKIDADLEAAANLKQEAEEVLAAYEKELAEAQSQAQAVIRENQEALAAEAAKQHEALSARLGERTAEAEARIAAAQEEAMAGVRDVAAELSGTMVQRLVGIQASKSDLDQAVAAAAPKE